MRAANDLTWKGPDYVGTIKVPTASGDRIRIHNRARSCLRDAGEVISRVRDLGNLQLVHGRGGVTILSLDEWRFISHRDFAAGFRNFE